jgi:cyclic pyranopterin phosphate synthase
VTTRPRERTESEDAASVRDSAGVRDTRGRALRDLRISVTDRCNFRCTYCMPKEIFGPGFAFLPRNEILSFEEIARLARIFAGLGVRKLRLTGGEPLLRNDLPVLVRMLRAIGGVDIALTTNGSLLAQHAAALAEAGLRRVTVSLDSLDETVFRAMNDVGFPLSRVLDGIAAAKEAGLPVKVNAVIRRGMNEHTVVDLARWARAEGHIMRFIEYMDVGHSNGWRLDDVVPGEEIVRRISEEMPLLPAEANYAGEVARRWRYADGGGEIGVITSVTQPFCGDCTRARLSADGKLYTCLFATHGTDLRALLRSGAEDGAIEAALRDVWSVRDDRYSELRSDATVPLQKVEMSYIGG